jgi:hypothetical protein
LYVTDAFVKRALVGMGHGKHETRLLSTTIASHPVT